MAQTDRAILLASAIATSMRGLRTSIRSSQLDASIYATAGAVLIGEAQISAPERGVFFR